MHASFNCSSNAELHEKVVVKRKVPGFVGAYCMYILAERRGGLADLGERNAMGINVLL